MTSEDDSRVRTRAVTFLSGTTRLNMLARPLDQMPMTYVAADDRYDQIPYRRCGRSGIKLPEISLGLWQNFGEESPLDAQRAIIRRAFDRGVTHFDLANNYGPP